MAFIKPVIWDFHMPKCNANLLSFSFEITDNIRMKWKFKEIVTSTTSEPHADSKFLMS